MICAGIDAGSRAIKIVLLDAGRGEVVASGTTDQGVEQDALASQLFRRRRSYSAGYMRSPAAPWQSGSTTTAAVSP